MKILKMLGLYALICVLEFVLFSFFIHVHLFGGIYFFRMFAYAILAGVLLIVGFVLLRKFDMHLVVSGVIISVLTVFLFISLFLAVVDRSYSVFSLAFLTENSERSYTMDEIQDNFITNYVVGLDATQRRVDEQLKIGNVEQTSEGYKISARGVGLIKLFRFIEKIFPVDEKRILY